MKMAYEYIDFKFNWSQDHETGDLNNRYMRQHLKALIRGYGSSTENIVLDFVNNSTSTIEQYDSIQQAWSTLDEEQKDIIDDLRALTGKGTINAQSQTFCHDWYRNVISTRYHDLIEKYEQDKDEVEDINIKVRFAEQAEQEIREKIISTDSTPVWSIKSDDY
jgi:hypothetical protein